MNNNLLETRQYKFKFFLGIALILLFLTAFQFIGLVWLIGFFLIGATYLFLRNHLSYLFIFSLPFLTFGQILNIPIMSGWSYEATITEIIILVVFCAYWLDVILEEKIFEVRINKVIFLFSLYFLASLFSLYYFESFRYLVYGFKVIIFSIVALFLAYNLVDSKEKINYFISSLNLTVLLLVGELLLVFYNLGWSQKFFFDRNHIISTFGPLATSAAAIVMILPLLFIESIRRNGLSRYYFALVFSLGALTVFLSLGKGAILSLLLGLGHIFYYYKNKRTVLILAITFLILIFYISFGQHFSGLGQRMANIFVDKNTEYRILEYKTVAKIVSESMYFGVGPGQQLYYFHKILNYEDPQLVNNFFMQAMVDCGFVGLIIAILILLEIRRVLKKEFNKKKDGILLVLGFSACLVAVFFNGLVEVTIFALPYGLIFWSLIGVVGNLEKYEIINNNNKL